MAETIADIHQEIIDEFAFLDDWMVKYQYLIDLGRKLPEYPEEFRTEDYKVKGCQSQVWFHPRIEDGRLHFDAISDAAIVSGLIALLLRAYSGRQPAEILAAGYGFIEEIGLTEHLSPTRGNGLRSMLNTIFKYAKAAGSVAG